MLGARTTTRRITTGGISTCALASLALLLTLLAPAGGVRADTADGEFDGVGQITAGDTLRLDTAGRVGIPDDARAVVLNITAANPAAKGYVTAYPCNQSRPNASNLNYDTGDVIPNLVIAQPDPDGDICLYSAATTHLVADVAGYFPAGSDYTPITNPARILDTRPTGATADGELDGVGQITAGDTLRLDTAGRVGIPDDARAVVLNITAANPAAKGYVTAYPCNQSRPNASNLNYDTGDVIPNLVIAQPDPDGDICLYSAATTHLVADVAGYFPAGSDYTPITNPARILDTRPAGGMAGMPGMTSPEFGADDVLPRQPGQTDLRLRDCGADGCDPRDPDAGPFPGIGTFRVFCQYSHQSYDDPILFPGEPGRSHLHLFFGNTSTDHASDLTKMHQVGGSTCDGGIADRSAYWFPTLYDPSTEEIIEPWIFAAYYQSGFAGLDPASIQPIPTGLRMIAGSAKATPETYANDFQSGGRWGCFNGGGGPTNAGGDIPDCGDDRVTLVVNFPQCWDGVNLDSADHLSHMAAPRYGFGGNPATCPDSHPVALPSIMLQIVYQNNGSNSSNWRLVSDMYPADQPGGASVHADFVNGWDPTIMDRWLQNCVRAVRDCERSELGNDQALASRFGV